MLLDPALATKAIDEALRLGADFCDLFIERKNSQNISLKNDEVERVNQGIDFGIGIRLIYGVNVVYGYTNSIQEQDIIDVVRKLGAKNNLSSNNTGSALNFSKVQNAHPHQNGLDHSPLTAEKIAFLREINKHARNESEKISLANAGVVQQFQQVEIFNSEGLHTSDERHYCRVSSQVIAQDGNEQATGYQAPGALNGWDFSNSINAQKIGSDVAKQALVKLTAAPCPGGKLPVIIDEGFGGVIFHEACGHLLETTSVQKKASVFWDKMGEQIAHECVNAIDDGTIENEWGSINIDDEGMKTKRTQLIKDGKLVKFLSDRVGEMKTGHERTGSGRRQSYRFAPASRMRNTFIDRGNSSLDEMIASIDHGIYCKAMGGGSVQPGTGEFNFAAQESYLIENGKVTTPLKSSTLIGTGPDVLKKISMVGDNLSLSAGMCGSVSGSVPVTVGQPAIKVDEILVGGQ